MSYAKCVLGCLLSGYGNPRDFSPEDFDLPLHRAILSACQSLAEKGDPVDLVSVAEILGKGSDWGGFASATPGSWQVELVGMIELASTPKNLGAYAKNLRLERQQRELREGSRRLAQATDSQAPPDQVEKLLADLSKKARPLAVEGMTHIGEALEELFLQGGQPHPPLGLQGLSRLHVTPGDLCVFAARPGCGKTAMLGTITLAAARAGWNVLFFSLEMPSINIRQRLVSALSGINLERVSEGDFPSHFAQELKRLPVWIEGASKGDFKPAETLESLVAKVRKQAGEKTLVVIDYLQIIPTSEDLERRYEIIGHLCRELKRLALSAGLPIITAAQLSRAAEQRTGPPQLSDLRESGEIEQVADQVVLMHREPNKSLLAVAKYRMGPTFTCEARFIGETCQFTDDWQA